MANKKLTILICTYKRNALLLKCLEAIKLQTQSRKLFEILIVDNDGNPSCKEIAANFGARYVYEPKAGLSFARNRGVRETKTEWILFLDDDGIASQNLVETVLKNTENLEVNIVGGKFHHYFASTPPKWLHHYYNKPKQPCPGDTFQKIKSDEYLSGGILAVKKSLVIEAGYFNTKLGMQSNKFGYGEEDELQNRLRKLGYEIFFDPEMEMTHLVHERKYTIKSRIAMAYAHGWASRFLLHNEPYTQIIFSVDIIKITFFTIPYDIARWLFRPEFYWQNAVISLGEKYAYCLGKLRSTYLD